MSLSTIWTEKMSGYPQPFHCLHCELGWTGPPRCWHCGRKGMVGVLPVDRLMHGKVTRKS